MASIPELTESSPPVQASRISTKRGVHRYANTPSHVLLARGHARVRNGRWPHRDKSAFCGTKAAKDVQITTDDASGLRENRQARQPAASYQSCDAAVTHREAANISKESLYVSSGTPKLERSSTAVCSSRSTLSRVSTATDSSIIKSRRGERLFEGSHKSDVSASTEQCNGRRTHVRAMLLPRQLSSAFAIVSSER